ncbi:zinc-finger domain-containing protein [Terricaulis sp.]|uniref:zinc-finger domain-containing protein n=1 Tax=Terricaulis sp. TaxID=2768686 RepID=UPI00378453AD
MAKLHDNPRTDAATPGDPDALPAPEIVTVTSRKVKCEGIGGALGHPVVYYDMGEENFVECLYCDRRFVLAEGAEDHGH